MRNRIRKLIVKNDNKYLYAGISMKQFDRNCRRIYRARNHLIHGISYSVQERF